jgi:hypothetical protein
MAKLHIKEPLATMVVIWTAAVTCIVFRVWTRDPEPPRDTWFPWLLLALGAGGLLGGIFDREMKPNTRRIRRADAIMFLLGPTASRILFGAIGGAFLGSAASIILAG